MHPVGYLFEDIYRNYWGIVSGPCARRRLASRAKGRRLFRVGAGG